MNLPDNFQPTGWMLSEKLDGWFAKWDGARFTSASVATISAPEWFTSGLPTTELRGELHAGRGGFESIARIVRTGSGWDRLRFAVFPPAEFAGTTYAVVITETVCRGREHLREFVRTICAAGGEGAMLRRGREVHKCKPSADAEAVVVEVMPSGCSIAVESRHGSFKLAVPLGAFLPPSVGSVVTFRFSGWTARGLPRHARLMRERPLETVAA